MPLVYACICPRAPDDAPRIDEAVRAMGAELASYRPDTALIVSSLGSAPRQAIGVLTALEAAVGGRAGETDVELAERVLQCASAAALPAEALRRWDGGIDAGCELPPGARIVAIAVSRLEPRFHFEFGQAIGKALEDDERRVAVVCVAELSRELPGPTGRIFDEHYRRAIEAWDVKWLVRLDADVRRRAAEDAVPQTAVLMGALSSYRIQPRVLAYEALAGRGQLVAAIDVLGPRRKTAKTTIGAGNGPTTEAR